MNLMKLIINFKQKITKKCFLRYFSDKSRITQGFWFCHRLSLLSKIQAPNPHKVKILLRKELQLKKVALILAILMMMLHRKKRDLGVEVLTPIKIHLDNLKNSMVNLEVNLIKAHNNNLLPLSLSPNSKQIMEALPISPNR